MKKLEKLFNVNMLLNMLLISAAITVTFMFAKNIASIYTLQETECTIEKVSYMAENGTCACGFFCRGKFPCVRVLVSYPLNPLKPIESSSPSQAQTNDANMQRNKPLRQDLHTVTHMPECSFRSPDVCHNSSNEQRNVDQIESTIKQLQEDKFRCLFDPGDTAYVLLRHSPSPSEISLWLGVCWVVSAFFVATSILLCWVLGACRFWQNKLRKILPLENENTLKEKQEKKRRKMLQELALWHDSVCALLSNIAFEYHCNSWLQFPDHDLSIFRCVLASL